MNFLYFVYYNGFIIFLPMLLVKGSSLSLT